MIERTIEDKTAKAKWVELYLPSQFSIDILDKQLQFWTEYKKIRLNIFKKTNQQEIAGGDVMLMNSNGDKFPMNYELSVDTKSMEYILKARPHRLLIFGEQRGVCTELHHIRCQGSNRQLPC